MADEKRKEIKLDDGEIMRLSVEFDPKTGNISTNFKCDGNELVMMKALISICDKEFDMICLPKAIIADIGICIAKMPDVFEDFLKSHTTD